MRETGLGEQQGFKKRQRCGASGERAEVGAKQSEYLGEFPGRQGSAGQKGDQVLGSAGGDASRILEAKLVKDRDLVQLKSDVFMSAMGMFRSCFWTNSVLALSPWDKVWLVCGGEGRGRDLQVHRHHLCSFGGETLQTHVLSTSDELVLPPLEEL